MSKLEEFVALDCLVVGDCVELDGESVTVERIDDEHEDYRYVHFSNGQMRHRDNAKVRRK